MTRLCDLLIATIGMLLAAPVLLFCMLLITLQDGHSPLYIATRVGRGERPFRMIKLRSMRVRADASGVTSTAADDQRITWIGRFVRRWKFDELPQLWNVLGGSMSLVGPRPQVPQGVATYTDEERALLRVRPGITDLASIVFADEGDILAGSDDPDACYDAIIRPWKSRLALLYGKRPGIRLYLRILYLTALNVCSRRRALRGVRCTVERLGGDGVLQRMAGRDEELLAHPPPDGAMEAP